MAVPHRRIALTSVGVLVLSLLPNAALITTPAAATVAHHRAGDIDGDGKDDLVVGMLHGVRISYTAARPGGSAVQKIPAPHHYQRSLAVGDFNGDGYADLALGNPGAGPRDSSGFHIGEIFLWYGGAHGLTPNHFTTIAGPRNGDGFGTGLSVLNLNGDRRRDLMVQSDLGDSERPEILLGTTHGLSANHITRMPTTHVASATSADVNGDGRPDLVVGRPDTGKFITTGELHIQSFEGTVAVYLGTSRGLSTHPVVVPGKRLVGYDGLGHALAVGRINGDRYPDVVVGAIGNGDDDSNGAVVVLYGGRHGLSADRSDTFGEDVTGFGAALSVGDLNGDGYADVAAGGTEDFSGRPGAAYLLFGSRHGLSSSGAQELNPDLLGDWGTNPPFYGASVVIYHPDDSIYGSVAVGAPNYWATPHGYNNGFVDVFPGSAGGADVAGGTRTLHARQGDEFGSQLAA